MLKMIVPLVLMLMPFSTAHAFDANFFPPGLNPYPTPPQVTCLYSFYLGRHKILITDFYGDKHVCQYVGFRGEENVYKCSGDNEVLVKSTWMGVEYVQFLSTPDLTAYCN